MLMTFDPAINGWAIFNEVGSTACRVMAKRLRDVCALPESEPLWKAGRGFVVRDLPWTVEKLRAIPPFEFENWAVIALGGIPNKEQVGDMGFDNSPAIDGWEMRKQTKPVPSGTKENALLQLLPDALRVLHLGTASVAHARHSRTALALSRWHLAGK